MASQFDETDFVDRDYLSAKSGGFAGPPASPAQRPPTREELEGRVSDTQQKLAELKRAQEELERERATLEEARRRRIEYQTGREEMMQNLTRGVGLLEEAEFAARRDAEQMAKSLVGLREALAKVEVLREEQWSPENFNIELTRALTTIENARMEWNSARLKWTLLNGVQEPPSARDGGKAGPLAGLGQRTFVELCRLGLALTWPVALVLLLGFVFLAVMSGRR